MTSNVCIVVAVSRCEASFSAQPLGFASGMGGATASGRGLYILGGGAAFWAGMRVQSRFWNA